MNRNIEETPIALVGAGNLATNLAVALHRKGFRIVQVYSRTCESAQALAQAVGTGYTTEPEDLTHEAQLYIVSLKDSALTGLLPRLTAGREHALWVHTAGSIPMSIWQGYAPRHGVLYPMQTFSKQREADFSQIPIFLESSSPEALRLLTAIASTLSEQVREASSEQRKSLHLAAVFACNFTNHMYALAAALLQKHGLSFDAMLPLIDETARKVHQLDPHDAQTGPAVRYDTNVIHDHLDMLADEPEIQQLYRLLSEDIHRMAMVPSPIPQKND
ncbi:MAG: DUF2520 domain-containing protein [Bacteroides sp.]|nr:DUF2520 domain-containing protein [Bacteroides sp.]